MNWKEFLKPNWKKIVLLIIINFPCLMLNFMSGCLSSYYPFGMNPFCLVCSFINLISIFILVPLFFIIWIYNKVKKK